MKALLLMALLVSAQAEAPDCPVPPKHPISAVFYEYCNSLRGVVVTFSDGQTAVIERVDIEGDPGLAAELDALPHIWVHLESPEICGCFT